MTRPEPFEDRLRHDLVAALPAHRNRRRRRDRALVLALTAVLVLGAAGAVVAVSGDSSTERASVGPPSSGGPASSTGTSEVTTTPPPSSTSTAPEPSMDEVPEEPTLTSEVATASRELTHTFLTRVREGDVDGAAALLSEYVTLTDGDARATVAAFATEHAWLLADPDPELLVTPSPGWQVASPVVTVVVDAGDGTSRAAAFVLSDGLGAPGGPPQIQRLPDGGGPATTPTPGTPVAPGQRVSFPGRPVEGGARAFVDGTEVAVTYDQEVDRIWVTIPPGATDGAVVTVSVSTPELPDATAAWFPVGVAG